MKNRELFLVAALAFVSIIALQQHNSKGASQFQLETQKQLVEQQQARIDSLHAELFIANSTLGRWELSLDHLKEVDPKGFSEFSRFYDHETE